MQTYMRRLAEVLSSICENDREPLVSISLNDSSFEDELHPNPVHYAEFLGANQSKMRFVAGTLQMLRKHPQPIAVLGHINLARTAYWLKRAGLLKDYVIVLHGMEAWEPKGPAVRAACRHAAAIVATTRYTACEFQVQNRFAHRRMFVVPISLPDHALPALPSRWSCPSEFTVLTVGRLDACERYKGVDTLIASVSILARNGMPVRLQVAGDGSDRERLRECARSAAPGAVTFLGNVPDERLSDLYRDCGVFAMPSRNEGFGLVFLEAMRHGKPCIGGRHGGTPEVIRDGVDGFLVPHGDPHELAQRLRQLLSDPALLKQLGRNAYAHAAAGYLFPMMRDGWRQVLLQCDQRVRLSALEEEFAMPAQAAV